MALSKRARRRETSRPASFREVLCDELLADPMVDVEELDDLLRDPSPLMVPEPEPEPEDDEPAEPEGVLARTSRIAGFVTALALLCGAVVAASVVHGRPADTQRQAHGTSSAPWITGVRALVGFDTDDSPHSKPSVSAPISSPHPATRTSERATDTSATTAPEAAEDWREEASTALDGADALREARTFYGYVARDPDAALRMLEADLVGSDPGDLVRAWRTVRSVEVRELSTGDGGMLRAVVAMTRDDGQRFLVTQLLRIEDSASPTITEARLLSSQRMPDQ